MWAVWALQKMGILSCFGSHPGSAPGVALKEIGSFSPEDFSPVEAVAKTLSTEHAVPRARLQNPMAWV